MKEKLALSGSLLSVLLASACCLGPILALTGAAAGLGFASYLAQWRPYLLGVTFLLLMLAIYFTYRQPKAACQDGSCPPKGAGRWNKAILWSSVAVVLGMVAFPYYAHSTPASADSCCTLKKPSHSNGTQELASAPMQCCKVTKGHNEATAQPLASLEINKLREEFNNAAPSVRVVAILSPTCPACQCGQGMLKKLFSKYSSTALKGFVTWTPMLNADDDKSANSQADSFQDTRVSQNWDAQHQLGNLFANTLQLNRAAWDVYLVYEPGVKWEGDKPPQPSFWMHQLKAGSGANQQLCLNQDKFSSEVAQILAKQEEKAVKK